MATPTTTDNNPTETYRGFAVTRQLPLPMPLAFLLLVQLVGFVVVNVVFALLVCFAWRPGQQGAMESGLAGRAGTTYFYGCPIRSALLVDRSCGRAGIGRCRWVSGELSGGRF